MLLLILLCCFRFFFFFQAEDGIRYLTVTGVQTCALPILKWLAEFSSLLLCGSLLQACGSDTGPTASDASRVVEADAVADVQSEWGPWSRSEERRVGKEGRSRWAPYH